MTKPKLLSIFFISLVLLYSFSPLPMAIAQDADTSVSLIPNLGELNHPVSTKSTEAQKYFDQGLTFIYAFTHDEAARSFTHAAELDPNLAMAYWGIALANGSSYNSKADDKHLKIAYEAIQKAVKLSKNATDPERDYIQALNTRYSSNPNAPQDKLAISYKEAMGKLASKYPDDLDAATLYAESIMILRPWMLWTEAGKPAEGTEEIIRILESVLSRNPDHPGANHYYIHAVEASPHPEYALPSARRLPMVVPASVHLVHMPAHIYMRVGDYAAAASTNQQAMAVAQEFYKNRPIKSQSALMYTLHNIYFLTQVQCIQGRFTEAKAAADLLVSLANPELVKKSMLEAFMITPLMVLVRFRRFDDILASPFPDKEQSVSAGIWHYARAFAYLEKGDNSAASKERQAFLNCKIATPADVPSCISNSAQDVLAIAELTLDAKFALKAGDRTKAIKLLRQAKQREDALNYTEPPAWILPVCESLGAYLLSDGQAAEAEKVFRSGLVQYPRSGRCLFGLRESLRAQKNDYAAEQIDQEFQRAWKNADTKELRLEDLEQ